MRLNVVVGHYVTYGRQEDGSWMFFSDEAVRAVAQSEVLRAEAYLLFYVRRPV